jgi:adenine-specific DNA methylase
MSRADISPIEATLADERQKLARYYGVHPYFTRRSAAVVRAYLARYSMPGDTVADPFGGSGVTAIEALLMGRRAIHNDLNPFANFMTSAIADTRLANTAELWSAFRDVADRCESVVRCIETEDPAAIRARLRRLPLPENIPLPRTSDAARFHDLFTPRQLAALATIRQAVDSLRSGTPKDCLLLAWSAAVAKLNRTFLSAKGRAPSRGGSSIFSIYRYKIAKEPVELPLWETFRGRVDNVVAAKAEVLDIRDLAAQRPNEPQIDSQIGLQVLSMDAAALEDAIRARSVDYIFTDPPYGGYISYLDLSILWNHWLGFPVSDAARANEAIVGGQLKLSESHYRRKLAESLACCIRLLRPDRWFSVVFQHWDTRYFETILDTATDGGCALRAAVTQEREVIWSMHKKKNAETMLAGEMILTFHKPRVAKDVALVARERRPALFAELLSDVLKECSRYSEVTSQFLFNRMIVVAWQNRALSRLHITREAFAAALREHGWRYDLRRHAWCREGATSGELFRDD